MDKIKLIDFLTEKIFEESKDANSYMEHGVVWEDAAVSATLNKIADEELGHQKLLIKLLADIAKNGITETKGV